MGHSEVRGRNLVLMFDGTWNVRDSWTNVARMFEAVDRVKEVPAEESERKKNEKNPRWAFTNADHLQGSKDGELVQLVKYNPGVGTGWKGYIRNAAGALWGYGLEKIMLKAYLWLSENHRPHDRIFVFGFSRGAFTARALVSLVHMCGGVLKMKAGDPESTKELQVKEAYELYSRRDESKKDAEALHTFGKSNCRKVRVRMVGVWDTVGAMGVPDSISNMRPTAWNWPLRAIATGIRWMPWSRNYYHFHNQGLPCIVDRAYHALAIDEHRVDFLPSLWNNRRKLPEDDFDNEHNDLQVPKEQKVKQCWFVGSHSNVGGGVDNDDDPEDLWQPSYEWMQDKAVKAGLQFKWLYKSHGERWKWLRDVDDSYRNTGKGLYRWTHDSIDRAIIRETLTMAGSKGESLHPSVKLRIKNDPLYRPPALLCRPGEFGTAFARANVEKLLDEAPFEDSYGNKYHTQIPFEELKLPQPPAKTFDNPQHPAEAYCSCKLEYWKPPHRGNVNMTDWLPTWVNSWLLRLIRSLERGYLHPLVLKNLLQNMQNQDVTTRVSKRQ